MRTVSPIEVNIKMMPTRVVTLVNKLAAPRGPKAVWDPLAAKGACQIGTLTLAEENHSNQYNANNHVNRTTNQIMRTSKDGAEEGT